MYTTVPIPAYVNIPKLIGTKGRHLKYITGRSGCFFMWVDSHKKVVEIWGPDESMGLAIAGIKKRMSLLTRIWKMKHNVTYWESGNRVFYEIIGTVDETKREFDEICKRYPYNPYMTQIEEKTPTGLVVTRFSSCE